MPRRRFAARVIRAVTATVATAAAILLAAPALAAPAVPASPSTTVSYPAPASATSYSGLAFDACAAPDMQAWGASPYHAIGIYVGGQNRACAQPELSSSWVGSVSALGWRLIPIFKGRQAPCGGKTTDLKIVPAQAAAEGTWAAGNAAQQVTALGMVSGSAIYYDMEQYTTGDTSCRNAVLTFLSAWTRQLHKLGYVSGVYENLNLGAQDLAAVHSSAAYARPDALWIARYDLNPALTGWSGIADRMWAAHQRAKQYQADFSASYGGVTLTIDADSLDAPVATTAFGYHVTSGSNRATARTGPGGSYPAVKTYPAGAGVTVVCQTPGSVFGSTRVWDKLSDGSYLTDFRVDTPSSTGYSPPLTRCQYPYQVIPSSGVNERSGPGTSYPVTGQLPGGALAWAWCQQPGSAVGTTKVWDKLRDGAYVSDYNVATPSKTSYSKPIPRC
jgi:glycoside hydrolase-like protein